MTRGMQIRRATVADAPAIGRIEVETWRESYAAILRTETLLGLSRRQRRQAWSGIIGRRPGDTLVALGIVDGIADVIGFGNCGPRRDGPDRFSGEIFTLYVDPAAQGIGVGRRLLLGLIARLVDTGHGSALVWVLRENPARFFYERLGGKLASQRRLRVGGEGVEAVCYGWPDLAAVLRAATEADQRPAED